MKSKNDLKKKVVLSILAGSFVIGTNVFAGEVVIDTDRSNKNIYAVDESGKTEGLVTGGNVTVKNGGKAYDVYAAVTGGADAVGNHATMTGGEVAYLAGAATDYGDGELEFASNGATKENTVTISGGIAKEAAGGESFGTGVAEKNIVTISDGEVDNAYGGTVFDGTASGNKVIITGGKVTGSGNDGYVDDGEMAGGEKTKNLGAYGAISFGKGEVIGNSVEISGDAQVSNAFGGYTDGNANVKNNSVSITGTAQIGAVEGVEGNEYNGIVVGGYTNGGNAEGNSVNVSNYNPVNRDNFDTLTELSQLTSEDGLKTISGGFAAEKGNVISNNVTIIDSTFVIANTEDNDASIEKAGVIGGYSNNGNVSQNTVTVNNIITNATLTAGGAVNGIVENNKLVIKGSNEFITGDGNKIYGGFHTGTKGSVNNNTVDITETLTFTRHENADDNDVIYGGYAENVDVNNNVVKIHDASIDVKLSAGGTIVDGGLIYGGFSNKGNINGNKVILSNVNGADVESIIGGHSNNGNVNSNSVVFDGTNTINSWVSGGTTSGSGTVDGNSVVVNEGCAININTYESTEIFGGASYVDGKDIFAPSESERVDSIVSNNEVRIDGTVNFVKPKEIQIQGRNFIIGGINAKGDVKGNSVELTETSTISSNIPVDIYGGYAGNGKAEANKVIIDGNANVNDVYGGVTGGGYDAVGNIAVINGGNAEYLAGGATDYGSEDNVNGAALYNKVYVNGGKVKEVAGGEAFGTGKVQGNEVYMTDGEAQNIYGGNTYLAAAEGNKVIITGGQVTGSGNNGYVEEGDGEDQNRTTKNLGVYGAVSIIDPDSQDAGAQMGELRNNSVEISGDAQVSNVFGAYSNGNADVTGNTVNIKGNAKVGHLVDGNEYDGRVYGGYSKEGDVTGNVVSISEKAVIEGSIYGGYSETGKVTNNKVIVDGTVTGDIYGGYYGKLGIQTLGTETTVDEAGNIVEIHSGANLENANIYGSNVAGKNDKIIIGSGQGNDSWSGSVNSINNVSEVKFANVKFEDGGTVLTVNDSSGSNLENTIFNAEGVNFDVQGKLEIGNSIKFVDAGEKVSQDNIKVGNYTQGTFFEGTLQKNEDGSVAVETKVVSTQTDFVGENRAVSAAFVNQGTDLISDGIDSLNRNEEKGVKAFASVYGNRSKYDIGRDMKINGWSSIVGIGTEKELAEGNFIWGVFYENGDGNYRFENSNINGSFRGDGSVVYNGGGVLARYEKDNGVYTEASLRAGMLKNEMSRALESGGNYYGYKTENAYYGVHLGVGKVFDLNDSDSLDVYGKFFHTYNEGDSFTLGTNEKYELGSVTSDRLRIGARITNNKESKISTYYGLAYEYEFDGEASGTLKDNILRSESLKGSSCMAEIGMNYKPSSESPWSFDLSMRGYAGQRDGFSGNVQAVYSF